MSGFSDKSHILVVDDDDRIRSLLARFLSEHDFVVMQAEDAKKAKALLSNFEFDLIVLDVMMPGEDGITLATQIRDQSDIPIILLTAKGEMADKIDGLSAGVDDYITKPFEPQELLLRIRAILKRIIKPSKASHFMIGRWKYSPDKGALVSGQETVMLTEAENALLITLSNYKNEIVDRHVLAKDLGLDGNERTIDVQVTRLRKKLGDNEKPPRILQTVRGKGYRLLAEDIL